MTALTYNKQEGIQLWDDWRDMAGASSNDNTFAENQYISEKQQVFQHIADATL